MASYTPAMRLGIWLGTLGLVVGCTVEPSPETSGSGSSTGEGTDTTSGGESSSSDAGESTAGETADPGESSSGCQTCCGEDCDDTGPPPTNEIACGDGIDDDNDGLTDCVDDDCWPSAECEAALVKVAAFNILGVNDPGTVEYEALVAVVNRLDAGIICFEEVRESEDANFDALRADTGYPYYATSNASGPPGNGIGNACLSRFPVVDWDNLYADDLSPDPQADDLTRPILRVRIRLEALDRYVTVFVVHLKAGSDDVDRFRRQVEFVRLAQAVALERSIYPGNALIAMGDFNEVPDVPTGQVFSELPGDLPSGYDLGADISLPLTYDPFPVLASAGIEEVPATLEESRFDATFLPSFVKLDYIYEDAGASVVSEVYEACEDDGVDAAPVGDVMPKAGEPLACGTNADASDHRPIAALLLIGG